MSWQNQAKLRYFFEPQPDITAFELATLLQLVMQVTFGYEMNCSGLANIPENLRRHFTDRGEDQT